MLQDSKLNQCQYWLIRQISNKELFIIQIISLKNELEIEKAKERKCAEELENPENDKRWRELEGEDPE